MNELGMMKNMMRSDFDSVGALDIYESCVDKLERIGYFDMPASTKYHGTDRGDLFRHSKKVAYHLKQMTNRLNIYWHNPRSPILIGYFHDLCKCDQYYWRADTSEWIYRKDQLIEGHGCKSVMIASTLCQLTEEEMLCIRYHMGAYETDDWNGFDRAIRKYCTVLWTHTADMLASKVSGI
jgi:hypothetical protein